MAENKISVAKGGVIQEVQASEITRYLDATGLAAQLNEAEKTQFCQLAQLYGLNPFKREIYCTVYGEGQYRKCSIVTGYDVYIKRAERTGKLNGWNVQVSQDGQVATITIWRKDWAHPFIHEVYYEEAVQRTYDRKNGQQRPNAVWAKMPKFMLKKVAIGQGFRLCFADEFGGMPYEESEMPQNERAIHADVVPDTPANTADEEPTLSEKALEAKADEAGREALRRLIRENSDLLSGSPMHLAEECLANGDGEAVSTMTARVREYIRKKGRAA